MINPKSIDQLAEAFQKDSSIKVATLAVPRNDREDYLSPNVVKVICNEKGDAIYFSRSPIPYFRDNPNGPVHFLKHLGIYGYKKSFLLEYVRWSPGVLEDQEKLEQLRILERGHSIHVLVTPYDSLSVDTNQDLEKVEAQFKTVMGV